MRKILLILILISIPTLGLTWTDSTGSTQTATTTDYDAKDILNDVYNPSLGMIKTSATSVEGGTTTITPSYYLNKKPAVNHGDSLATGNISDTDFNIQAYGFYCLGGDATVDLTGAIADSITVFQDIAVYTPLPLPTVSSITFTISSLTSGATLQHMIVGIENK